MTGAAQAEPATPPGGPGKWRGRLAELHPKRFFLETWQHMDEASASARRARAETGAGYDWRPLIALGSGAVFLTLMQYFGMPPNLPQLVNHLSDHSRGSLWWTLTGSRWSELYAQAWWSGWRVLGFVLLPCAVVKLSGQRIRDQGLETRGFLEHAWIYALAYAFVLLLVIGVSFLPQFQNTYPFYQQQHSRSWGDLLMWEMLYAAQFFSLEFFFRGWWLRQLEPMMGSHAIFAMIVPYCMIHYGGKPFLEALGAIAAGIFLGTLAMKTRSIWSGFLIHVSVAVSMDVAALMQKGGLPHVWWPGS